MERRQGTRRLAVPRSNGWTSERAELEEISGLVCCVPEDRPSDPEGHDLRHTCASLWLGAGADPKVVQRVLGHASAAMTMDLYGHLIDQNLWDSAKKVGGTLGAFEPDAESDQNGQTARNGA